jgi:hypothetical protein
MESRRRSISWREAEHHVEESTNDAPSHYRHPHNGGGIIHSSTRWLQTRHRSRLNEMNRSGHANLADVDDAVVVVIEVGSRGADTPSLPCCPVPASSSR